MNRLSNKHRKQIRNEKLAHAMLTGFYGRFHSAIVTIKGTISDEKLAEFRTHWLKMISGVEGAHWTPVVSVDVPLALPSYRRPWRKWRAR